jgi:phospholipase A1/A2
MMPNCPCFRRAVRPVFLIGMLVSAGIGIGIGTGTAHAQEARILVDGIAPGGDAASLRVRIVAINAADDAQSAPLPDRIAATLTRGSERFAVTLQCDPAAPAPDIAPGRFALADCTLPLPEGVEPDGDVHLSVGASSPAYALVLPRGDAPEQVPMATAEPALPLAPSEVPAARPESGNAFLGNISSYGPIYAAYGPGTDSDARLQISFKYQLFGTAGEVGGGAPVINGVHFGYTQRMFWDLGAKSSPFRNIDFMPEIFYLQPAVDLGDGIALGGQFGFRHESNGRDGEDSRSANTLYIQPVGTFGAGDYTVSIGPRLFAYVGDLSDNPDIRRYRGSTGLFAEIGQDNGFRLTTSSRLNFSSGKGAIDAELSYPLDRIVDTDLNVYVFGQGFAGYGENLLDYNRSTTRLRVGVSIVR